MNIIFIITFLLNQCDYLFTKYWVEKYGIGIEANPFGRFLFKNSTLLIVFKLGIVGIGLIVLREFALNGYLSAKISLIICMVIYIIVFIIHIVLFIIIKTK